MWNTSDGSAKAGFHYKSYTPESWPPLRWTVDQRLCARAGVDELLLFDGAFPVPSPVPLWRLPCPGIDAFYVSPDPAPLYSFITFSPTRGGRPGSAHLWSLPNVTSPVVSRSMQADGCRVEWAPEGSSALLELTLAATADSYYGDSRAFLMSRSGVNMALEPPKEGSVHDFAWSPGSDTFIVIAGKSPPAATLYSAKGVPTFSFGAAAHNTIRYSPNGMVVLLAGFGNMGGTMTFWDVGKKRLISHPANAQCVVNAEWSPDSRYLLTATLRPRLQVDNGYKVWDYHGRCVAARDCDFLYDARWAPLEKELCPPPRSPSPLPPGGIAASAGGSGGSGSGGTSTAVSHGGGVGAGGGGKYIPPSLRGVSGDARVAASAMNERYTPAGKIAATPVAAAGGVPPPKLLVGQAPPQLSKGQIKKLKEKEKATKEKQATLEAAAAQEALALLEKGGGGGGVVGGGAGASREASAVVVPPTPPAPHLGFSGMLTEEEREKALKKLQKKVRDVKALIDSQTNGATLDEQQLLKIEGLADLERRIAELAI